MKSFSLASLAVAAAAVSAVATPSPSQAADSPVAFNAGAVTDYRYRGISQTRLKPALQGGLDFTAGGFYLGAWASTIKWVKDGGGDANVEIDLYGGYKGEIAKDLFISENTVKNHVRNILEKLQLHSRMEAVMYAVKEKLLDLP